MSENSNRSPESIPLSRSPEAERDFIQQKVEDRKRELSEKSGIESPVSEEDLILEQVGEYKKREFSEVIHPDTVLDEIELNKIVLDLSPEEHDDQMQELISLVKNKGIKNALRVVDKMKSPHIQDDFHRFLVAYVKKGYSDGVGRRSEFGRELNMVLFEVTARRSVKNEDRGRDLKTIISSMEQFYTGMLSVKNSEAGLPQFSIELALENIGSNFVFYVAVPRDRRELFEKQLLGVFPDATLVEKKDDYNIFNPEGVVAGSYASLKKRHIFPIRTYDEFDLDPLNSVLNSFSKVDHEGEGVAIQIVVKPKGGEDIMNKYSRALNKIRNGESSHKALDIPKSFVGEVAKEFKYLFLDILKPKKKDAAPTENKIDEAMIENIQRKTSSPLVWSNMRILASSRTKKEAEDILYNIESSFNQFERGSGGNRFSFNRMTGSKLNRLAKDFSFRRFRNDRALALNLKEISTFMHFQTEGLESATQLKQNYTTTAPAPTDMSKDGVLLGVNRHRGEEKEIRITEEDRLRHFYVIGQTGTGKSTLLKNMITQDIQRGDGVCMIDPHGSDLDDVLATVPKERIDDVIYFDPADTERPMGLNMLEYDQNSPEQKTFVVNELFAIFDKLFDLKSTGGPMFEQYFRNSALLVMEDPESGNTLLEVSRVLADEEFRKYKLSRCNNVVVKQYWEKVAQKAGGEASLANIVPYITSKFDVFLSNDIIRPIVLQHKSSFNFREIMDNKKILLINLSKGRLGDLNSHLLGLILVGKILLSALSRGTDGRNLPTFYLHIDEFQNVTTDSISVILSEARKYRLSLTVAHQYIAQLEDNIRDSVIGNVGSMAAFRVGATDAEYLEKQFSPPFSVQDLLNVQNRNSYLRMLVNGHPTDPFSVATLPPPEAVIENIDAVKKLSALKYGRPREEVEQEINSRYQL